MTKDRSEKRKDETTRVVFPRVPRVGFEPAALALMYEAKNLYNTTTFLLRQVATAYDKDASTKLHVRKPEAELQPNQIKVIPAFNRHIALINKKRRIKADAENVERRERGEPPVEPKLLSTLDESMVKSPMGVALDVTLLDNVAKNWVDHEGHVVYRRLPASSAQQVVRSVIDVWKAAFAALAEWAKHPEKFSGRPDFPGYIDKNGYYPLEIPFATMKKGFPRPKLLPELSGVSSSDLQAFYAHDLRSSVIDACRRRGWDSFRPQHVRIVEKGGSVRIEAVVAMPMAYPDGSFLKTMFERFGDDLHEHKTDAQRQSFILSKVKDSVFVGDAPLRVAGIDFGERNVATAAFTTGHRAMVHSGHRPWSIVVNYDQYLDALKGKLATPRLKELQALQSDAMEKNVRLSRPLRIELAREWKKVYGDPEYRRLVSRKDRVKADFEHKISTDLVDRCLRNDIHVIVVGQNKGMKQDNHRGSKRNRSSHLFAHHRLLGLIRYKAEKHGIAVVTTEESYTSKASFVDNDVMSVYDEARNPRKGRKKRKQESQKTEIILVNTQEDATNPAAEPHDEIRYSGTRSISNRDRFIRRNAGVGERKVVHADVNGAFNIIRKMFDRFRYHVGLSLKFNVRWISPRCGATLPRVCLSG